MALKRNIFFTLLFLNTLIMHHVKSNPVIGNVTCDSECLSGEDNYNEKTCTYVVWYANGYDPMEICIENCAQCKKMLGAWFEGPLCAKSCIKFKGKLIPECEDFASISPFLNKL